MIVPACPGCGVEQPPGAAPCRCGYRDFGPPPQPPPQPRARQLPALKLELGRVKLETEKATLRPTQPLRLQLGKVKVEQPPKPITIEELFLLSARAISTENLATESRFIAQRNDAAHRRFMRAVDRVAPDRSEWREEFLVW